MTVIVNNLSVVHKDSGGKSMSFPDVCKTPAPPGPPVPIPYPNVAMSSDAAECASSVVVEGNPVMHQGSNFSTSSGDEAGSVGGVVSGKTKGKAYPKLYSFDVKVEGQSVFRFTDLMLQNGGSPVNTGPAGEMQSNTGASGKDAELKDPEVTRLKWSRSDCVCGDKVKLSIKTKNVPDETQLTCIVKRAEDRTTRLGDVTAELSGNKADPDWIVVRGRYKKAVSAKAFQEIYEGKESSGSMEIKTVEAGKEPITKVRVAPQYTAQNVAGHQVFLPSGYNFLPWTARYDIEIKDGELVVMRKIDFQLRNGARLTAKKKRAWKREIEAVWNRKWKIHRNQCKRGGKCDCSSTHGCCAWTLRIVAEFGPGQGGEVTELWKGANNPTAWGQHDWWYVNRWWEGVAGVPPTVRAHEFGHQIGMYDEYPEGACEPSRAFANVPNSIMNAGSKVYRRHVQEFHDWFDSKARGIVGRTTLVPLGR